MSTSRSAAAYQSQAVGTATGPQLLIMLYDRLAVDISRAEIAIESADFEGTNEALQHAQRIVRMLRTSLDPDGFVGGQDLLALYVFLEEHLVRANLEKDVVKVRECADLVQPLHEAWRRAIDESERDNVASDVG